MRANPRAGWTFRIERRAVLLEKVDQFCRFNIFGVCVCPGCDHTKNMFRKKDSENVGQGSAVDSGEE